MFGLGTAEIVIIVVVAVVLFGAKRIPEFAKSLGLSVSAFKSGLKNKEGDSDVEESSKMGENRKA